MTGSRVIEHPEVLLQTSVNFSDAIRGWEKYKTGLYIPYSRNNLNVADVMCLVFTFQARLHQQR